MLNVTKKLDNSNERDILYIALLFFIITGIYFRFFGIGKWCFAIDEFFTASSVRKILDNGIPRFEFGGYYIRGLFFQYFEALLSLIFGFNEATLRFGSIFFNLLTIPGLYFLGRKIGGGILGVTAVGIFSISLIEIEMSRYIRMYTAFQCMFVWYLLVQIKVIIEKDSAKIKWLYIIAFCSIFVHEGAIFPVLLLFLPLFVGFPGERKRHILISIAILMMTYFYLTFDFRHFGTTEHLPLGYEKVVGASKILLPNLYFLNTIIETKGWLLVYGIISLSNGILVYKIWRATSLEIVKKGIITVTLFLGMVHMFGAVLLILFCALMSGKINMKDIGNKSVKTVIGCTVITFVFWFLYGIFTDIWTRNLSNVVGTSIKKVFVVLIKYPNIFDTFVFPWGGVIPFIFVCLFFSLLYILFLRITQKEDGDSPLCLITLSLISCISLLGIIPTIYSRTRYSFFLYPVIIILILFSLKSLINRCIKMKYQSSLFFFLSMFLFMTTDDFNLDHLMRISTPDINFRMDYEISKSDHFMVRRDFMSPSQFINKNCNSSDIIIIKPLPCSFYLDKTDYVFLPYDCLEFPNLSIQKGERELWTSAKLLSRFDDIENLVNNAQQTIWLIDYSEKFPWQDDIQRQFYNNFLKFKTYTSLDGIFNVLKIPPASSRHI